MGPLTIAIFWNKTGWYVRCGHVENRFVFRTRALQWLIQRLQGFAEYETAHGL